MDEKTIGLLKLKIANLLLEYDAIRAPTLYNDAYVLKGLVGFERKKGLTIFYTYYTDLELKVLKYLEHVEMLVKRLKRKEVYIYDIKEEIVKLVDQVEKKYEEHIMNLFESHNPDFDVHSWEEMTSKLITEETFIW